MKYLIFLLALLPTLAQAAPASPKAPEGFDAGYLLICSALVFFMQAGFCLLELGLTRSKNTVNSIMKSIVDFGIGGLVFFLIGFTLLFGKSIGGFLGFSPFAFSGNFAGDHPVWIFFLFQLMFASAAVTISSGAMAERTTFRGYTIYAAIATAILYPIIGHWCWGGGSTGFGFGDGQGWLAKMGFRDFAGGAVVHIVGGAFSLAGVMVVGARKGRFSKDGSARIFPGHSAPLSILGSLILALGWFAFNAGSNLNNDISIGRIATVTFMAGCSGMVGGLFVFWLKKGWADMDITMNGMLGGFVAATPCCAYVSVESSLLIGLVAGVITVFSGDLLSKFRLDDAVGAIPVHLVCGLWGVVCVGIFDEKAPFKTIGIQALGAAVVAVAAFVSSYIVFMIIHKTLGLRVDDAGQATGLDFAEHSATAYPDFMINENALDDE